MKCSSIMNTGVECCRGDEVVETVAERMRKRNIGFMPVCDDIGSAVGALTDRDLAVRVLGERRDAAFTLVEDVMSLELVCCSPNDDLSVAEELMERSKKSRIVCVDEQRRPVGIISLSDIAHFEQSVRVAEILDAISCATVSPGVVCPRSRMNER